jgi:4-amino-4-deoxy-L-arabinose transferase-like glycosyltransferase
MPAETIKRIGIILMLGLLTASAFFVRLENFKNSKTQSIDEVVYYRMAKQVLAEGLSGYNTIPYGRELAATGRPLPDYFFQPLFKHPPLFTFLVALSMKLFGPGASAAASIPLLFGTLMIPLGYLLGMILFNRRIGLLSAFFLWLDPVSIMCSQKVWMETTVAFFTLLAAVVFAKGIKSNNDWFFILSGLSSGLAVNTKYPAVLIAAAFVFYASFYNKDLFRNRKFQISLALPFISLLPWMCWNYRIYGLKSIPQHEELNALFKIFPAKWTVVFLVGIILTAVLWLTKRFSRQGNAARPDREPFAARSLERVSILFLLFLGIFLKDNLWHSLQFDHLPFVSWRSGTLDNTPLFYLGRLIEYSFFYVFAFIALFMYRPDDDGRIALVRLPAAVILLFYIVWGNYQSRYILACVPLLIVLGAQFWVKEFETARASGKKLGYWGAAGLAAILAYSIVKTYAINLSLSYTNDMCYF